MPQASTVTDSALVPGMLMQPKSVPRLLVGAQPLALHPVAMDLHQRLAGDHRVGGVVPVAVLGQPASVCVGDLAERSMRLAQRPARRTRLGSGVCAIEAVVDVGPGDGGDQRVEQVAGLEGLAADGERDIAGRLDLVEVGEHVVERGPGRRIDAGGLRPPPCCSRPCRRCAARSGSSRSRRRP